MHEQVRQNESTSPTPAGSASPSQGQDAGDVLKIIADVEGHLTRLRSAQKQQDDAIASLTTRSKSLRQAEEELERHRAELAQQRKQLAEEHASLQHERESLAADQRQAEAALEQRKAELQQQQAAIDADRENTKAGLAELEQAKATWDQNRQQIEAQLRKSAGEIDARMQACEKASQEMEARSNEWEKKCEEARSQLERKAAELDRQESGFAQREEDLRRGRERLDIERQQMAEECTQLRERAKSLERERAELLERVEQAERNVGELIAQVEKSQSELTVQTRSLNEATARVSTLQKQQQALEHRLEQVQAQAAAAEAESQELLRLAENERTEVQQNLEAKIKELDQVAEARDAAMAELESARKKIASLQRDLQTRDEELSAGEKRAADLQRKLELAGSKLSEFAQVLSEQTPQLERGAAALAMVEEQAEQIDRLTSQLAELQLASDPEEIRRRDERISELTEALRQARGQNGGEVAVAEIEQRNAALEQEVQRLRLECQNAEIASEQARKQLQEYIDSGAEAQVQGVALNEHAAKIAALTAELERQNELSAQELKQQLSAQSKKFQQELATARESEEQVAQLRKKIADLEAALAKAKANAVSNAAAASSGDDSDYVKRLRAKAEQITLVADHLRRRRARLEKLKRLMAQKQAAAEAAGPTGTAALRGEQLAQIERERAHLLEVRKMLAQSEYVMIRRWARQKAVFMLVGIMFVILSAAGATWLAVDHLFPAVRSASLVLEARQRAGAAVLTDEQKKEWTAWHADIPADPSFHSTLSKRMGERQLVEWSRPEAVAAQLKRDFKVDASRDGVVVYTMSGVDEDQLCAFLDVFAHTAISESNRQDTRRVDGAMTIASGERKVDGRACYASVNPVPVKDERMQYAGPVFGGVFGGLLLLSLGAYIKLARTKRVFEDENGNLFQDLRPAGA